MPLEQEIKEFMKSMGVDVVGLAGPGRYDGPPSLDPNYVMRGAKSVIAFAMPFDVEDIYAYLGRKTAIPHNIDQFRVHQRVIWAAIKLKEFLKSKGYRAAYVEPNASYRKDLRGIFALLPKFSHRYAAYVTGIASPGISGSAVTKEYGGAVCLNSVVTDAVLEGDPMLDPRYHFDGLCQECMACKSVCPPKMFKSTEEEYALINGQLYPRGRKRDINLCGVSCGGLHAVSADKTWSNWGKGWIDSWTGREPDPEKEDIFMTMVKVFGTNKDLAARVSPLGEIVQYPVEKEGYFEKDGPFPSYEDLEGETEGQKLRSFADALEKVIGNAIADPLALTCNQCNLVCSPNAEESLKRAKLIHEGGILCFKENNEPVFTHDFDKAVERREKTPYQVKEQVIKESLKLRIKTLFKYVGFSFHTIFKGRNYQEKLNKALAEKGLPPQKI